MGLFDSFEIEITCPGCGQKFKHRVGRKEPDFECPACRLAFKADELRRRLEEADKAIRQFGRSLGRL